MTGTWRVAAFVMVVLVVIPSIVAGQQVRAGVVTTVRGSATVTRQAPSQPAPLRFKDDVFVQDRIVTGESAVAQILLGGKAVVTVREHSELTITEVPGTATVDLRSGRIALAVLRHRMQPGDSVEIHTPNAVAGVRGTVVIAEVARGGAQEPDSFTTRITVLRGLVDVVQRDARSGHSIGIPVNVGALESVLVGGATMPSTPQRITPAAAQSMTQDFQVGVAPPPAAARAMVTEAHMKEAVAYATAMLPSAPGHSGDAASRHRDSPDDSLGSQDSDDDTVSSETANAPAASITNGNGNDNGNGNRNGNGNGSGNGVANASTDAGVKKNANAKGKGVAGGGSSGIGVGLSLAFPAMASPAALVIPGGNPRVTPTPQGDPNHGNGKGKNK